MTPTAIWRSAGVYVVEWTDAFWVIATDGAIRKHRKDHVFSDEDDLWTTTLAIERDALVELTTVQRPRGVTRDRNVLVAALERDDDPASRAYVAEVIGDHEIGVYERKLAAEARVTAIDGSTADHGLGAVFARAQHALAHEIRVRDDKTAANLLRTLVAIARAAPRASDAAINAYATGCLLACYIDVPGVGPVPEPFAAPLSEVIVAHAVELERSSDYKEWMDARSAASYLARAAHALRVAGRGRTEE